jgi:hypothetical protein
MWTALIIGLVPILALGGTTLYLGSRYLRVVERQSATDAELAEMRDRLLRLEEAQAEAATEMGQLHEQYDFAHQLLSGRQKPPTRSSENT